ncbi:hypothetical protein E4T49_06317 [Aureobasidium sp. EXF-10728]|nr:hypothetical protein E4T49_06317 [Aureobasidium sp. EXF-10728]
MASIALPTEILRQILLMVPRHELAACARVSKMWHTYVTPLLYEQINLRWRRPISMCDRGMDTILLDPCPCEQMGYCEGQHLDAPVSGVRRPRRHSHHYIPGCITQPFGHERSYPSLYLLARTLISAPSLARLVSCLRLTGPLPRSVWTDPEQTHLSFRDWELAQLAIGSTSHIPSHEWFERLDNGDPTAFTALVLVCVPSLRLLNLGVFEEKVWMGRGIAPFYQSSQAAQLLFLHLPALRELSLNLPDLTMNYLLPIIEQIPVAFMLESLSLSYTYLNEHGLYRLLLLCPHLRSLKYDYWTRSPGEDPDDEQPEPMVGDPDPSIQALVNVSVLERALRLVKDTLQSLHLHIVSPRADWGQLLRRISFCDFPCLTTLHVPLQLLVNKQKTINGEMMKLHHSLPATLQELWLNDDGAVLWLNHSDFLKPWELDWELDRAWFDQQNHPIHTDEEVINIITEFLHDSHIHTPALRSLKLLFYFFDSLTWGHRKVSFIKDALISFVGHDRVAVEIYEVLKRAYRCHNGNSLITIGEYPPYFHEAIIDAATNTEKYIRE